MCSTYSSLMPSGPHTKTAKVFAASRTSATSSPRRSASRQLLPAGVDQQRDVVEQRPLGRRARSGFEHQPLVADLQPLPVRAEAERRQALAAGGWVGHAQHDVVDVVVEVGTGHGHEAEAQALGALEGGEPVARTRDLEVAGQVAERRVEVPHAQHDALERAGIARALGGEQRQLAAARIRPDQGEVVGALDHVHAEVGAREVRQRIAVRHPEGDVIEGVGIHRRKPYPPARDPTPGVADRHLSVRHDHRSIRRREVSRRGKMRRRACVIAATLLALLPATAAGFPAVFRPVRDNPADRLGEQSRSRTTATTTRAAARSTRRPGRSRCSGGSARMPPASRGESCAARSWAGATTPCTRTAARSTGTSTRATRPTGAPATA